MRPVCPINIEFTHGHAEERNDEVSWGEWWSMSGMGALHPRPFAESILSEAERLRVTDANLFMTAYLALLITDIG